MTGFGSPQPEWKDRLKSELARDKKKTAILGVLMLVAAIVGVRMALCVSPSPDVAEAAAGPQSGAMPGLKPGGSSSGAAGGASQAGQPQPKLRDLLARGPITVDLFSPKLDSFPLAEEAKGAPVEAVTTQAEDPNEVRAANLRSDAKALVLQSTSIADSNPRAVINGQLLGLKDVIEGFEIVEITAGACVVQREGVRVPLEIRHR